MGHSDDDAVRKVPHKIQYRFELKSSIKLHGAIKIQMLYLSNAPLNYSLAQLF